MHLGRFPATGVSRTAASCTVTSPAGTGTVPVTVTISSGTSTATSAAWSNRRGRALHRRHRVSCYLTVFSTTGTTSPLASDVNWVPNETVPNFMIADTTPTGTVDAFNSHRDTINLVIDAFGEFQPAT